MRKSPAKWIKTVLFGKKSSKSNFSKDATLNKKTPITTNSQAKDFSADSVVISSPVRPVIDASGERTQLEKSSSANLTHDTVDNVRNSLGLNTANDEELIKLEQAATKAQAAFRGYLARRAFWALKGIIRLQALVRGHLVRRQAVATLSCMRAIVEFQALVRGQKVRASGNGQMLQKKTPRELVHKERANLLQTSLRSEKLSTNAFGAKLVASSNNTMPLSIQYDPAEPNSTRSWLDRWSTSHFWDPLPRPKKTLDAKPKRKQPKSQSEETETGRPKRSFRKVPAANLDSNPLNSSETEKPKRTVRKASAIQSDSVPEQSNSELEKVKRSLRKISVSTPGGSEKPEAPTEKIPTPEPCLDESFEKVNEDNFIVAKQLEPEPLPALTVEEKPVDVNPPVVETNGKVENGSHLNVESNGKENQKARRRKSFPGKQEYIESVSQNSPPLPSYMAATESAKAKLRAQAAARAAEEGGENGSASARRQSLPSTTSKLSLQSPRVQKPLQSKGGSKTNKLQISPRDEKVLTSGWRR